VKKVDIATRIADKIDITKAKAEDAVNTILDEVKQALAEGESVIIRRFGTFQVREKNTRLGRNPKTGEKAEISARRVVRFKSGKHFKDAVNGDD
jgi:integration host factor alpha subunit